MKYGYDPSIDYQKLINKALEAQDYRSAAIYEQQRNEKIAGEGAVKYKPTAHYADYLPKTQQVNAGLDALQGAGAFAYDVNKDPSYQALYKQALREADRQTRDTMAAYASMTGGVPSTAAVSAAAQAGNYERSKLNDAIPTLRQAALNEYLSNQENERANLNLLNGIETQREETSIALRQQEIQNAMNRWAVLGTADKNVAAALGVAEGTPTSDAAYQKWQQQQTEQQQAISNAMDRWTTLGVADEGVAAVLGVAVGTPTTDASYRQWQQSQTEQSTASDTAMLLISLGQMPSDQILAAAGLDKGTAQQLLGGYAAQASGSSGGSTRSSGGSTKQQTNNGGGDGYYKPITNAYDMTSIGKSLYRSLGNITGNPFTYIKDVYQKAISEGKISEAQAEREIDWLMEKGFGYVRD